MHILLIKLKKTNILDPSACDFNKHDVDIFINDMWQKYTGNIGWLFKITRLLKFAFDQREIEVNLHKATSSPSNMRLVRDSSAVRRLLSTCCSRGTSESSTYGKQRICLSNSWSAHFHVSWLSDFIFYQKPLYKSLHQSFFYSFITILPSESGVTLHYSTILP